MVAQSKFSHKQLLRKNTKEMQEMMFQKDGTNWNDLPAYQKRGYAVYRQGDGIIRDFDIPVFTQDRGFIEQFLATDPEDSVRPRLEVDRRVLAPETEVRFLGTEPKKWKDCN
jgi:hypothetical protein